MKSKYIYLITIILIISAFNLIVASNFLIKRGNVTTKISSVEIRGTEYVPAKELARVIGASYYFNSIRQKVEIKYNDFNLKFTANNQFVILTEKKRNQHQIFQLPISSKFQDGDVFIPIKYAAKYLALASGFETKYIEDDNTLIIDTKKLNTNEMVNWNKSIVDLASVKYDIFSAKIENKSNGTLLRLAAKKKIIEPRSSISNNTLYIFFTDVTIDKNELSNIKPQGFIRNVGVKHVNGNPQLEIKLREGYDKYEVFYDEDISEILISIHNKFLKNEKSALDDIDKWKFDVIVLDAGHGGKDPGSIGLNGIKEKDINLAVTKELGKLISSKLKETKVVYTREDDRFIELYKRGKIANEHKGNLFISIHCNSTPKKPTNATGFEVYLLRPGRTQEAIDIAEFENSVISLEDDPSRYQKLTDENFILVSMAHASNMRYSETFADMLNTEWIKTVGLPSRGIKQAGFYVLVGASMPGVLVELGFISNKNDSNFLSSKKGQKEIAESLFDAILKYKNYYESSLTTELDN